MRRVLPISLVTLAATSGLADPQPFPPRRGPDPRIVGPPPRPPSYPRGYATNIEIPGPSLSPAPRRVDAATYVYLHSLPPRLATARDRYRARLFLTLDPILTTRAVPDGASPRLRTELDLLWTPRTGLPVSPGPTDVPEPDADPWALVSTVRFGAAQERFIDLAIEAPDDPSPKLGYALATLASGQIRPAQFALRRSIELSAAAPALGSEQTDQIAPVLDAVTVALDDHLGASPNDTEALLASAVVHAVSGDHDAARRRAVELHRIRPRDAAAARLVELLASDVDDS